MAANLLAQAGISLLPSLFKGISSIIQGNKARSISPVDPNFTMNQGIIDNASQLGQRASNYNIPNYRRSMNDIGATYSGAFNRGVEGASSSGDVLDLATKIAYGQASAENQLNARNEAGRENAYLQSLNANAQAGQQYQDRNAYDRAIYQQQLRERAGLVQASNENAYGAINDAAVAGSTLFSGMGNQSNTRAQNGAITNYLPNATVNPYTGIPQDEEGYMNYLKLQYGR